MLSFVFSNALLCPKGCVRVKIAFGHISHCCKDMCVCVFILFSTSTASFSGIFIFVLLVLSKIP